MLVDALQHILTTVARFLEFGTKNMPKNPFMTRAFESNKSRAVENMTTSLDVTIQECAAEAPKGPKI